MYNMETGKVQTYMISEKELAPLERPKRVPTPCGECPKKSPENEWLFQLNDANRQLLDLVKRSSAPGFTLPEHLVGDRLWQENYSLVMELKEQERMSDLALMIARNLR